jgi:glutaminyl-peptide cyclotransferase
MKVGTVTTSRSGSAVILSLVFMILLTDLPGRAHDPLPPHQYINEPVHTYRVIAVYPHDPQAFTQGLVYHDGVFFESTGLHGLSTLRRVDVSTGRVRQSKKLPGHMFAEGLTLWKDRLIQLTWLNGVGLVFDVDTFELIDHFRYDSQGWGLTHDGKRLIMSDGSDTLTFLDPDQYTRLGQLRVRSASGPLTRLNELEYVKGEIWANVWHTDRIARISPITGRVLGWIDLAGLLPLEDHGPHVDVLNGIAHDPAANRIFVTGKHWPKLFEIDVIPIAK